ncbi:hypothetical protein J2Z18_004163 [Paenibacillus lactis]|uniref:Uncharacterized protein n=1 Tax=Paenibacillus lactis TaxID=228574 RepID=A0ABS4FFN7_9BACL|nr:hypothetical protein [Paenibacillus lactis]
MWEILEHLRNCIELKEILPQVKTWGRIFCAKATSQCERINA